MVLRLGTGEHQGWIRWVFLRLLGLVFLSAFVSLLPQVRGLVGEQGILPAARFLKVVAVQSHGVRRFFEIPTLLWLDPRDSGLVGIVWLGLAASLFLALNLWPRAAVAAATVLFLSLIAVLQDFASYQSDGMLMEAGVAAFFLAPAGVRPGLGGETPSSRLARIFLVWEWFRIYFESGLGKLLSGDPEWRHLTALDHYFEYGPLPTVLGYWAQKLPHGVLAGTALFVLLFETLVVFLIVLPRPFRLGVVCASCLLQASIEFTANYTFLNILVFALGLLLLPDPGLPAARETRGFTFGARGVLGLLFYVGALAFPLVPLREIPSPFVWPLEAAEPFRLSGRYGLFAVMTRDRQEIEFQGSRDGETWTPYPFRFKPQALDEAPGTYAPYHPRFDWNLWFASLGPWEDSPWVEVVEERLLQGSPPVLRLFAADPFHGERPRFVRSLISRYSFTTFAEWRASGRYWRREDQRLYAPTLEARPDGSTVVRETPEPSR